MSPMTCELRTGSTANPHVSYTCARESEYPSAAFRREKSAFSHYVNLWICCTSCPSFESICLLEIFLSVFVSDNKPSPVLHVQCVGSSEEAQRDKDRLPHQRGALTWMGALRGCAHREGRRPSMLAQNTLTLSKGIRRRLGGADCLPSSATPTPGVRDRIRFPLPNGPGRARVPVTRMPSNVGLSGFPELSSGCLGLSARAG